MVQIMDVAQFFVLFMMPIWPDLVVGDSVQLVDADVETTKLAGVTLANRHHPGI